MLALSILAVASMLQGAPIAFDNASQPAYDDGWQSGDNGGSGFGPWSFSGNGTAGIGSSTANGDAQPPTGDIDSAGSRAWSLAHSNVPFTFPGLTAIRPLTGSLAVGQHILFDADAMDTFGPNGNTFIASLGNAAGTRWELDLDLFGTRVFDKSGIHVLHSRTPEGSHIDFTLTGSDSYTANINVLGEAPTTLTGMLSDVAGSPIDRITFGNQPELGGPDVFYVNNLAVIPEPGSSALLVGMVWILAKRRRRPH
jgi:hypothetical protein